MPLNLKPITYNSENLETIINDININFQQIVLNGGGPRGLRGLNGFPGLPGRRGDIGQKGDTGTRGSLIHFIDNLTSESEFDDLIEGDMLIEGNTRRYYSYVDGEWIQQGDLNFFEEGVSGLVHFLPDGYGTITEPTPLIAAAKTNYTLLLTSIYDDNGTPTVADISDPQQIAQTVSTGGSTGTLSEYAIKMYVSDNTETIDGNYIGRQIHMANASAMVHDSSWAESSGFTFDVAWDGNLTETLTIEGQSAEGGHKHIVDLSNTKLTLGGLTIDTRGFIKIGSTLDPLTPIDVDGGIKIGNATTAFPGVLKFDGRYFQGYNGQQWIQFGQSSGITLTDGSTSNVNGPIFIGSTSGNVAIGADDTFCAKLNVWGSIYVGEHSDTGVACNGVIQFKDGHLQVQSNGTWINLDTNIRFNSNDELEIKNDDGNWIKLGQIGVAQDETTISASNYSGIRLLSSDKTVSVNLDTSTEDGIARFDISAGLYSLNHLNAELIPSSWPDPIPLFRGIGFSSTDNSVTITPQIIDTQTDPTTGDLLAPFAQYDLKFNSDMIVDIVSTDGTVNITKRLPDICSDCNTGTVFDLSCVCGSATDGDCVVIRSTIFTDESNPYQIIDLSPGNWQDPFFVDFPVNEIGGDMIYDNSPFTFKATADTIGMYKFHIKLGLFPVFTYSLSTDDVSIQIKLDIYKNDVFYSELDFVNYTTTFDTAKNVVLEGMDLVELAEDDIIRIAITSDSSTEITEQNLYDGHIIVERIVCNGAGSTGLGFQTVDVYDIDNVHKYYYDSTSTNNELILKEGSGITLDKIIDTDGKTKIQISTTSNSGSSTTGDYDWSHIHLQNVSTSGYITKGIAAKKNDDVLVIGQGPGIILTPNSTNSGFNISLENGGTDLDFSSVELYKYNYSQNITTPITTINAIKNDDTLKIFAGNNIVFEPKDGGFIINSTASSTTTTDDGSITNGSQQCNIVRYDIQELIELTTVEVAETTVIPITHASINGEGNINPNPFSFAPISGYEGNYDVYVHLTWRLDNSVEITDLAYTVVLLKNSIIYSTLAQNVMLEENDISCSDIIELTVDDILEIGIICTTTEVETIDTLTFEKGHIALGLRDCGIGISGNAGSNVGEGCNAGVYSTIGNDTPIYNFLTTQSMSNNYSTYDIKIHGLWVDCLLKNCTTTWIESNANVTLGDETVFTWQPAQGEGGVYSLSAFIDFEVARHLTTNTAYNYRYSVIIIRNRDGIDQPIDQNGQTGFEIDFDDKKLQDVTDVTAKTFALGRDYLIEILETDIIKIAVRLYTTDGSIARVDIRQAEIELFKINCGGGTGTTTVVSAEQTCANVVRSLFDNTDTPKTYTEQKNNSVVNLSFGTVLDDGAGTVVSTSPFEFHPNSKNLGEYDITTHIKVGIEIPDNMEGLGYPSDIEYDLYLQVNTDSYLLTSKNIDNAATVEDSYVWLSGSARIPLVNSTDSISLHLKFDVAETSSAINHTVIVPYSSLLIEQVTNVCVDPDFSKIVVKDSSGEIVGRKDAFVTSDTAIYKAGNNITIDVDEETGEIIWNADVPEIECNVGVYTTSGTEIAYDDYINWPNNITGNTSLTFPLIDFTEIVISADAEVNAGPSVNDEIFTFSPAHGKGGKYHINIIVDIDAQKDFTGTTYTSSDLWGARISLFSYINGSLADELDYIELVDELGSTGVIDIGPFNLKAGYIYDLTEDDELSFQIKIVDKNHKSGYETTFYFSAFEVRQSNFSVFMIPCGGLGGGDTSGSGSSGSSGDCNIGKYWIDPDNYVGANHIYTINDYLIDSNVIPTPIKFPDLIYAVKDGIAVYNPGTENTPFVFIADSASKGKYQINVMVELTNSTMYGISTTVEEYELWLMKNGLPWQLLDARRWDSTIDTHVNDEPHIVLGQSDIIYLNKDEFLTIGIRAATNHGTPTTMTILPQSYVSFSKITCGDVVEGQARDFIGGRWNEPISIDLTTTPIAIPFTHRIFSASVEAIDSTSFLVSEGGIYDITVNMNGQSSGSFAARYIYIYVNGGMSETLYAGSTAHGNKLDLSKTQTMWLAALGSGDTIEIKMKSDTTETFSGGASLTFKYLGQYNNA